MGETPLRAIATNTSTFSAISAVVTGGRRAVTGCAAVDEAYCAATRARHSRQMSFGSPSENDGNSRPQYLQSVIQDSIEGIVYREEAFRTQHPARAPGTLEMKGGVLARHPRSGSGKKPNPTHVL